MKEFIKTLDEKTWSAILSGWTPPTTTDAERKISAKLELAWTYEQDVLANHTQKH